MYAVFNSSFTTYLKDFVDVVIVWIAPWVAIFLVDWVMRRYRYVPRELQRTDRGSLYYRNGGFSWPAIVAQVVGMYAAISALSATFSLPQLAEPDHLRTRDATATGPTSASSWAWASAACSTCCSGGGASRAPRRTARTSSSPRSS